MTTAKNNPQTHMEEEHIEITGLLGALEEWEEADAQWDEMGKKLQNTRKDAKDKVVGLVPKDGQPHLYRVGRFQIKVSLTEEMDVEFTRKAANRMTLKSFGG